MSSWQRLAPREPRKPYAALVELTLELLACYRAEQRPKYVLLWSWQSEYKVARMNGFSPALVIEIQQARIDEALKAAQQFVFDYVQWLDGDGSKPDALGLERWLKALNEYQEEARVSY